MKKTACATTFLLIALVATTSRADFTGKGHVHTLAESEKVFLNRDCETTKSCDLKRFTLTTLVQEVWFSDDPSHPTHGNGAIMEYETNSVGAIEKYAIVQFVKGCVFSSAKNRDGVIDKQISYGVSSFGENVPLCFPKWVIDSQDTDPVYNSDPEFGRFHLLRWNAPGSHDDRTEKYYGAQKPTTPVVYMTDYPAGAFVTATGVKNTSLQFKTCIYKAHEVPTDTRRENVDFARPINCFEWQNIYVYDFDQGRFRTDLMDYPQPTPPAVHPKPLLVLSLVLLLAGLSLLWLKFLRSESEPT